MSTNDDLDDFFKKKDRKINKHKKQTGLLTNNEELLKQLVIVTSATSQFKENIDFNDDEDEEMNLNNHNRLQIIDETNGNLNDEHSPGILYKNQPYSSTMNSKNKTTKLPVKENHMKNEKSTGDGQQDEWEEYENENSKYEQLRSKFSRSMNEQNNWDEDEENDYFDDEFHNETNRDENSNNIGAGDEQSSRNNRRNEQQKEKPVWNLDQIKQTNETNQNLSVEKVEEPSVPKFSTVGAYRPPQLRGNSSVTIVSGGGQRSSKKEKPNLASKEEFPTLGAANQKK